MATARKLNATDHALLVQFKINLGCTRSLGIISVFHYLKLGVLLPYQIDQPLLVKDMQFITVIVQDLLV